RVTVGNRSLLDARGIRVPPGASEAAERLAGAGQTPLVLAVDGRVLGVLAVADRVRSEAAEMVAGLHAAGVDEIVMLTGDAPAVAADVAAAVGIDTVRAALLPDGKLEA